MTPTVCVGCQKRTAVYECDAHVMTRASDTCDATVCADCSVRILPLDLDVCPRHASEVALEPCLAGRFAIDLGVRTVGGAILPAAPRQSCQGATLYPPYLCVRHARLFGFWLRHRNGWDGAYRDANLTQDQKRRAFVAWCDAQPETLGRFGEPIGPVLAAIEAHA